MSESYILCEGYHDRAFWSGLLHVLGAHDPGLQPDGGRKPVYEPWRLRVAGGEHAYESRSGKFLRIVPAGGRDKILPLARNRLIQRDQKALEHLVLMIDADTNADGSPAVGGSMGLAAVQQLARGFDPAAVATPTGMNIDGGTVNIACLRWQCNDPIASGLPPQNTLERIVTCAIVAAHPERGPCVGSWLDSRPNPGPTNAKTYSWSYLAGWYADFGGYEAFVENLWRDPLIRPQLQARLEQSGIWQLASALAN